MSDESDAYVVHILLHGFAMCGFPGLPCDWPTNHKWVGPYDEHLPGYCSGCLEKSRTMKENRGR
jgi:hypothetical protein